MLISSFISFSVIGALATGLQYAISLYLVLFLKTDEVFASALGYTVSAIVNYLLNYKITFQSNKPHSDVLPKFGAVAGIGLFLNSFFVAIGVNVLGINFLITQLFTSTFVLFWNFLGNKFWSFDEILTIK